MENNLKHPEAAATETETPTNPIVDKTFVFAELLPDGNINLRCAGNLQASQFLSYHLSRYVAKQFDKLEQENPPLQTDTPVLQS